MQCRAGGLTRGVAGERGLAVSTGRGLAARWRRAPKSGENE